MVIHVLRRLPGTIFYGNVAASAHERCHGRLVAYLSSNMQRCVAGFIDGVDHIGAERCCFQEV